MPTEYLKLFNRSCCNLLLPRSCIVCNQNLSAENSQFCCQHCYELLPFQNNACQHCGQQFAAPLDICGHCISKPPQFERCFCAFAYQDPIKELIQAFKYQQQPSLAKVLAKLLHQEVCDHQFDKPEALIPVPMHYSRLRERGYNQALLLAKELGKLTKIKVDNQILSKQKAVPAQALQNKRQRKKAVRGSFSCVTKAPYSHVAIIDDVVTTGSTISEITKILRKKGVNCIQVWAIAHTN